jgi:two-component system nitrogen regulation sensor histidine kinase GlnL
VLLQLLKNSLEHSESEVHIIIDEKNGGSIEIQNSNPGIPADVKSRMFHPFVTTKANELGIGLTTALLYVQKLGGVLLFKENEEIVSFKLKLPLN